MSEELELIWVYVIAVFIIIAVFIGTIIIIPLWFKV